jgi:hypothetical protein
MGPEIISVSTVDKQDPKTFLFETIGKINIKPFNNSWIGKELKCMGYNGATMEGFHLSDMKPVWINCKQLV